MKNDAYTKVVLTVIALTLVNIYFRDVSLPSQAVAQSEPPKPLPILAVNVVQIDGMPIASRLPIQPRAEAIPVRIINMPP